ncbi:MAG: GNAT family N-acetyltransferase [Candidatus Krumholzibacteria bacterium]|nr:GNAT family N-acetyltransferase [Candidatus Krumholzibacteria bacterium]
MSETNWRLRTAQEADFGTIAQMLAEADLPGEGMEGQFGNSFVVAEHEGNIVGSGGVEVYGHYGLLRSVVVDPAFRGKGLGEAIVSDRLRWSARQGLRAVYLLTTTVPEFFEKIGFTEMSRAEVPTEIQGSKEYSEICPVTATAMVVRLDPLC